VAPAVRLPLVLPGGQIHLLSTAAYLLDIYFALNLCLILRHTNCSHFVARDFLHLSSSVSWHKIIDKIIPRSAFLWVCFSKLTTHFFGIKGGCIKWQRNCILWKLVAARNVETLRGYRCKHGQNLANRSRKYTLSGSEHSSDDNNSYIPALPYLIRITKSILRVVLQAVISLTFGKCKERPP
jgi:hypothetical protein